MEEQSFEQYRDGVLKKGTHKQMKVTNSWGTYDVYKSLRKHGWRDIGKPVKEKDYYAIIRGINSLLAENIANGETVVLPAGMGKLELRKRQKGVSLVDGKLKITYPVDWGETLKLWYEDEEARNNKTLLRNETDFVYHVKYEKFNATYENKLFYQFVLNRFIKKALKENILNGKIETLW